MKNLKKVQKKKWVFHPERLMANLIKLALIIVSILVMMEAIKSAPKPTTWQWADAAESGMTWQEYNQ